MELAWFDRSVVLVHARQVDLGGEFHLRRASWIVLTANNRQKVNAVVKVSVWWPDDGSVPVCERFIVT